MNEIFKIDKPSKTEAAQIASNTLKPYIEGESDVLILKVEVALFKEVIKQIEASKEFKELTFTEVGK